VKATPEIVNEEIERLQHVSAKWPAWNCKQWW
jgi:hypothetical protein